MHLLGGEPAFHLEFRSADFFLLEVTERRANRRNAPHADIDRRWGGLRCGLSLVVARCRVVKGLPAMSLRLKICRDDRGTWNVDGLSQHPLVRFPSLSASLDYARRECAGAPATIELLIDGFYAVVHQEDGWPRRLVGFDMDHPRPVRRRAGARGHPRDTGSIARLRSSWFIKWRDAAIRSIAALAPGFMAVSGVCRKPLWLVYARKDRCLSILNVSRCT
jgi:hypothetical protein